MATSSVQTIRVFLASPGEVATERESTAEVVNELNRTISALLPGQGVRLELVRWETHAFPSMGRAQGVINEQIGPYDIFIGVLWKRFGTPTGRADSGTEEEFRIAYTNWAEHGKPHILFYFNREPFAPPRQKADVEQLAKVVAFREELESQGLVWEYPDASAFASALRPHLTEVVGRLLAASRETTTSPRGSEKVPARRRKGPTAPVGGQIRLVDIGPEDGFFSDRAQFIGRTAKLIEAQPDGEWFMGKVKLNRPAYKGDDMYYPFAQFKFEVVDAPHETPRVN